MMNGTRLQKHDIARTIFDEVIKSTVEFFFADDNVSKSLWGTCDYYLGIEEIIILIKLTRKCTRT